jgi:hypothetical protein
MSTIITRNSATSGSTPFSLVQGELAINVTDGRLFYGSGSGNVVKEFTGSASSGATNTGSLLTTASFSNPNLTFTKGNGSTFNVDLTSLVPTSASFALTASFAPNYVLNSATSSFVTNAQTSSMSVASASFALTASYYNETDPVFVAKSASLATTGSNTFNGSQTINGDLIVNGTASITFLNVTYESASVIYSSGSNQFGDASNDTQTLWGTVDIKTGPVLITGSLNVSGGITGSLLGTASYATNALSASNALTASFITASGVYGPYGSNSVISASYALNALSASYAQTASYVQNAVSASYALNGGVTQLLAGPNVTLSPTNGLGQVTVSATLSGSTIFNTATGSYGSFYDTTTQTNPVANIARSMSFNSTDITNGVSISGSTSPFNTYIKTTNAGIYNIQFSAQVDKTDGGTDDIVIWLRKNGIDLTDTATTLTLPTNNSKVVAAWNWFVSSAANDYYQIIWRSDDTDLRLLAEPISVNHPGIPSVILTVNRVDQFLSNTGSFSGSFTGEFTGSLQGTASFATTASYALNALSSSYALSSSFASTVPASGVIGLNLSQIATASFTASVSPTQFTVTSASITEFTVTGTGVTIGNAITDTHTVTGSLAITGSTNITGPLTATQIGVGAAPSGSVPLDVRAQGALSTDLAFRVRNSTNTYNIIAAQGDGDIQIGSDAVGTTRTTTVAAVGFPRLVLDTSYSTDTAIISVARRMFSSITIFNDNALVISHNSFSDGNNIPYKMHFVNPSTYYGSVPAYNYNAGFMWFKDNATVANLQMKLSPDNALSIYTSSASPIENAITGSGFQIWASGSAGNAYPHIRTQNGTLLWLGDESRLFNVTSSVILNGTSSAPSLNTTARITQTNSGSFTVYSFPTASYDTAFFEYSVKSGSNARAGTIMAIQAGSTVNFTETTTIDIGNTTPVSFTVVVTGSNMALTGSSTSGAWTIKTIVRSI